MKHLLALSLIGFTMANSLDAAATKVTKISKAVRLTLNWKPEPQFGGFYAAQERGFFKDAGLKVQIQPGGSGTPTVQMVASKKTEYAIVSADELVMINSKGGKLVGLFAAYQTNPQAIMTHADRGFKTLEDVFNSEGTLAMQKGLPYATYLLKKYASSKVKIVPYAGGIAQFGASKTHSQQCFFTSEPILAKKNKLNPKVFLVSESGYNPYTTVLVTTQERMNEKPDEVAKVVEAVRQGWESYLSDPITTNKFMVKLNPSMTLEEMNESAVLQSSLVVPAGSKGNDLGVMTVERLTQLIDQLFELQLIKNKPNPQTLLLDRKRP